MFTNSSGFSSHNRLYLHNRTHEISHLYNVHMVEPHSQIFYSSGYETILVLMFSSI